MNYTLADVWDTELLNAAKERAVYIFGDYNEQYLTACALQILHERIKALEEATK